MTVENISKNKKEKKTYRMPSMCDRILYSFLNKSNTNKNASHKIEIKVLPRELLLYSDHKMIYAEITKVL